MTKTYKIYGANGHRQRSSFGKSVIMDFGRCTIEIQTAEITGTNEYTLVSITAPEGFDFTAELEGQISDGFFENDRVGHWEEV